MKSIRLRFKHGLGDAVQFGIVLKHLRKAYPEARITLETHPKREACFRHLVDEISPLVYPFDQWSGEDRLHKYVQFGHAKRGYLTVPCSKVTQCLEKEFDLAPDPELYRYEVSISDEARKAVANWYEQLGQNVVAIHYEGVSCPDKKNLPRPLVKELCERLVAGGVTPVILDWGLNKLANGETIFKPQVPHDSDHLAALIEAAQMMIGIDSGPAHIAGALDTPTYCIWRKFFPACNFDLADNVTHFVCNDSLDHAPDDAALEFFDRAYRKAYYDDIEALLFELADDVLYALELTETHPLLK